MTGTLNETPRANRLHIGFYGRCNSGKSSLINAFANQKISIVSEVAGTTTDPVYKSMEIHGLGACVLIDTAGFDDISELGEIRIQKTKEAAEKTDIAVILFSDNEIDNELSWYNYFRKKNTPVLVVISKADTISDIESLKSRIEKEISVHPIVVSAEKQIGIDSLKEQLIRSIPEDFEMPSITGRLVSEGDIVLLCMPQDIQAPKGRLILPQVQTTRDLLDNKCIIISVTTDKLDAALAAMKEPPKLIITDSQVYKTVYEKKPAESMLTSFSTLFAAYKGDYQYYYDSAKTIDRLTEKSKVLIAECCTHAPLAEDIGREKLPAMLRKRVGSGLTVDIVSGTDFPQELTGYDLIIQCGACMFNRKYVMSRINRAKEQNVPMTNYGVAIAYISGIIDFIVN
jgi:[FeFe] hydrogenase H-cluster maturation GTPase HydF